MFDAFRQFCERLLRIPPEPEAPPGDEARTQVFRASPNYLRYLKFLWAVSAVASIGILLAVELIPLLMSTLTVAKNNKSREVGAVLFIVLGCVLVIVVAVQLFRLAVLQLEFEKRWYVVTNRSLRVREGVVHVREMTVTFANIQNISVSQGPLQRHFKIADLRVDTAGGGSESAKHPGLNLHTAWFRGIENAEEVKALIQARLRGMKDAGLGDRDDPRPASPDSRAPVVSALRDVLAEARALRTAASRDR